MIQQNHLHKKYTYIASVVTYYSHIVYSIPAVFQNGSNYNYEYHLIIKGLASKIQGKICISRRNTEK